MFCRFRILVVLSLFASVAHSGDTFPLKAERILFLGDSITNAGYFIADIETQLRIQGKPCPELLNLGLPSETCTGLSEPDHPFPRPDVHERLQRALDQTKPDVVVACYGMNDGIYYPFDESRFEAFKTGIMTLVKDVRAAKAKLVLLTPPPFDPHPMRGKPGKLRPLGAEKYAWFAIYENYDRDVIRRYAEWVLSLENDVDVVIDVYHPMQEALKEKRKTDPDFFYAADGVHMDAAGHEVLAEAILKAWGVSDWVAASTELRTLIKQKEATVHDAWLSKVGHKRPGVKAGLPLSEANERVAALEKEIQALLDSSLSPQSE